jgi:hypothetical protein
VCVCVCVCVCGKGAKNYFFSPINGKISNTPFFSEAEYICPVILVINKISLQIGNFFGNLLALKYTKCLNMNIQNEKNGINFCLTQIQYRSHPVQTGETLFLSRSNLRCLVGQTLYRPFITKLS